MGFANAIYSVLRGHTGFRSLNYSRARVIKIKQLNFITFNNLYKRYILVIKLCTVTKYINVCTVLVMNLAFVGLTRLIKPSTEGLYSQEQW